MGKIWLSVIVVATLFMTIEMASVEIFSNPTKVVVTKPKPFESDMKLGRSVDEKVKDKKSSNLMMENNTDHKNASSKHLQVKHWPSVFVLKQDPINPIICYAGKTINIHKDSHNDLEIATINDGTGNDISLRKNKKFVLSSDPLYPVVCQELNIPPISLTNMTAEEGNATVPNNTCIRVDYEKNISAIFYPEVGPIQTAYNIFNSTAKYAFFNAEHVEKIGKINPINETIVECKEYGVIIYDKGLSEATIASLLGVG